MESVKSTKGRLILLATILASGMAFLDGTVVNVALPDIQKSFGANVTQIEWIVNGFALTLASLLMVAGSLGDRFGRKKIFLFGILVFTLSSLLCAFSATINQLILFRALQGIGSAFMIPGSLAIINSSFKEDTRGKAIGLWAGLSGGIAVLGPLVGGFLVEHVSWQSIFLINLPLGLIALLVTMKFVPESRNDESTKLDILGTIFITLSLFGLSYGLMEGPSKGWSIYTVGAIIFGLISMAAFVTVEMKVKEPLVPFKIFKNKLVLGSNLATLFLYGSLYSTSFFLVLNFIQLQGYSPTFAGLAMLPSILIITFVTGHFGGIADRIGPRIPMIIGPILVGFGFLYMSFAPTNANYFISFLPGLILFGLGMSIVIAPLTKSALSVPNNLSGSASGVNNAVSRIAALLSVAILGAFSLFLFSAQLTASISSSSLKAEEKAEIISQSGNFGAIDIPSSFDDNSKIEAKKAIDHSLHDSLQNIMFINTVLAFLAGLVSFLTISNNKSRDEK